MVEKKRTDDRIVVGVSVTGHVGLGEKIYQLAIKTENVSQPVIDVFINARHLELFEAKPSVVLFDRGKFTNQTKLVKIVSNSNSPIVIEKVRIDNSSIISVGQVREGSGADVVRLQYMEQQASNSQTEGFICIYVVGHLEPIVIRYICM